MNFINLYDFQKSKEMHAENARKEAELREDFNRRLTKREEELRREEEAVYYYILKTDLSFFS